MTGSAILAITAWGVFVGWLAYQLSKDLADWRRTQRRGHERIPVVPRPAWLGEPTWEWPYQAMARQQRELRGLPEIEPNRKLAR